MFNVPWLDVSTRLIVAAVVGWAAWRVYSLPTNGDRTSRIFLAHSLVLWSVWYVVLAVFNPPINPWGVLNRALWLPLAAALINMVAVWSHHNQVVEKESERLQGELDEFRAVGV